MVEQEAQTTGAKDSATRAWVKPEVKDLGSVKDITQRGRKPTSSDRTQFGSRGACQCCMG